ncbi:hypothetical protein BESB_027270 [Besnoitia besnoiti]|uniref:Fe-S metabolism associated domain-containing protein n=1 Tax=Besnoitia besnoiti TaxID=94643 RepID=A0A2A9M7E8_BESBE|nr:uncharacterized protein BESB_027270 [Besnoitia besnoiti]PFH31292.1 hypothetical protein BESB_027270 [Besnoitia besnoiti]
MILSYVAQNIRRLALSPFLSPGSRPEAVSGLPTDRFFPAGADAATSLCFAFAPLVVLPLLFLGTQRVARKSVLFVFTFFCLFFTALVVAPQASRERLFLTGSSFRASFLKVGRRRGTAIWFVDLAGIPPASKQSRACLGHALGVEAPEAPSSPKWASFFGRSFRVPPAFAGLAPLCPSPLARLRRPPCQLPSLPLFVAFPVLSATITRALPPLAPAVSGETETVAPLRLRLASSAAFDTWSLLGVRGARGERGARSGGNARETAGLGAAFRAPAGAPYGSRREGFSERRGRGLGGRGDTTRGLPSEADEAQLNKLPAPLRDLLRSLRRLPPNDTRARMERLLSLGNGLQQLPLQFRTRDTLVLGCQSLVHVHAEARPDEAGVLRMHYTGSADALTTKGLLQLLVRGLSGSTPDEVIAVPLNIMAFAGLTHFITPSRMNGFTNILKKMKEQAAAAVEAAPVKRENGREGGARGGDHEDL